LKEEVIDVLANFSTALKLASLQYLSFLISIRTPFATLKPTKKTENGKKLLTAFKSLMFSSHI
jgi:hypothetical protein